MKKVLIVINTSFVSYGGLTSSVLNYYTNMDKEELAIDFASSNEIVEDCLLDLLSKNKSRYYSLGLRRGNAIKYFKSLNKLLKTEKYDIVHINGNSSIMVLDLIIAWINRIPVRIVQGHTSSSDFPLVHKLLKPLLRIFYTKAIAVSDKVGKWLFGSNYIVLNNAINIEKYAYSKPIDIKMRKELGINDCFVIGHVGKLMKAKNHLFLIELFSNFLKTHSNSKLVLVGGGELEELLKQKCIDLKIENSVLFLGMRTDVQNIIQTFNIFVFPSIYEGLPLSLIEAQANGLKCLVSSNVSAESMVTNNVTFLNLDNQSKWEQYLNDVKPYEKRILSKEANYSITEAGYNITEEAKKLREIYLEEKV